jgi:signal transduction histidine kinase
VRPRQALDAVLAAVLLVLVLARDARTETSARLSDGLLLLSAMVIGPLVWRRRVPVTVWMVCIAVLAVRSGLGRVSLIMAVAPLVVLYSYVVYSVATDRGRPASLAVGLLSFAGLVAAVAANGLRLPGSLATRSPDAMTTQPPGLGWDAFILPGIVIIACWLAGNNVRVHRAYSAELQAHAAHVEASRAADLARVAAGERARIARELHDAVVHNVSVIAVQAGAARMLTGNGAPPSDMAPMWLAVEGAARQALTELRQILGLLRNDGQPPDRTPPPSLRQLTRLADQARRSGLPVQVQVEGHPVPLALAVDLSAYRIVQEALTNVIKHQGPAATTVSVRYQPCQLEIEVLSQPAPSPPAPPRAGHGHGLVGMRERVDMLGGHLDAGPQPDGGFAVVAQIPLEAAAP